MHAVTLPSPRTQPLIHPRFVPFGHSGLLYLSCQPSGGDVIINHISLDGGFVNSLDWKRKCGMHDTKSR